MAQKKSADLLAKLAEEDSDDLLNDLDDADAEAWVPEDAGDGIQGTVIAVEEIPDQFKDDEMVPVVTIETKDGDAYRIVGFASVLRKEIRKAAPRPGDTFAVKFFGEKTLKTGRYAGKPFKHYKAAIRRNPAARESAPF